MDHPAAAGLLFGEELVEHIDALPCKQDVEPEPLVRFLRQSQLVRFVGSKKIPLGRGGHARENSSSGKANRFI